MPLLKRVTPGFNYRLRGSLLNALIRFHNQWRNLHVDVTEDEAYHGKLAKGEGRSVLRVALPTVSQRGGTGGGGGPTIDGTGYCTSRTGSGTLCGWSKYDNWNAGDWNFRKLRRFRITGTARSCCGEFEQCTGARYSEFTTYNTDRSFSGCSVSTADCSVSVGGGNAGCGAETDFGTDSAQCYDATQMFWVIGQGGNECDALANVSSVFSDFARVNSGDGICYTDGFSTENSGTVYQELSEPDSVAAALERGTSTTGSGCKTTAGSIASTTIASRSSIAISGTTSVTRTEPLSGLTPGADYQIDFLVNRYTAGGGSFVDQITVTVDFTAGASSEDLVWEVPVNTDYDYEWDSTQNLVLVP